MKTNIEESGSYDSMNSLDSINSLTMADVW